MYLQRFEDMENEIAFLTIATGRYKENLLTFFKSVYLYTKTVIVATDDEETVRSYHNYGLTVITHHVTHLPIPLIYTISPVILLEAISKAPQGIKYIYVLQSNCVPVRRFNFCLKGKVLTMLNQGWHKESEISEYILSNQYTPSTYISSEYQYVWGALIGGDLEVFIPALRCMVKWLENDLSCTNTLPKWHQEAYFNKWNYLNPHRSIKVPYHGIFFLFGKPQVDKNHVISQLWE